MEQSETINKAWASNAKITSDWFNSASSTMLELYKKQLNFMFDFYANAFNSAFSTGNNYSGSDKSFTDFVSGDGQANSLYMFFPWLRPMGLFNPLSFNPYFSAGETFLKQFTEYNQRWQSLFQSYLKIPQNNWEEINERYQELVETRIEALRNITQNINDSFTKQLDFSLESNKKLLAAINDDLRNVLKAQMDFWSEVTRTPDLSVKEKSKSTKREAQPVN